MTSSDERIVIWRCPSHGVVSIRETAPYDGRRVCALPHADRAPAACLCAVERVETAPVRAPEDGVAPGIGESRMCRCGHSHSWHQKNGRCGQVSDEWSGGCLCREFRPAPVPEDGSEGAEWTVVQRELGWYVPGPGHPRGFGPGSRRDAEGLAATLNDMALNREVRVPVEARDHDLRPSDENGQGSVQSSGNPEQPAPAPVSEEPEGWHAVCAGSVEVCPCGGCRRLRADHGIPDPAPVSVSERSDDARA